MSEYRDVGGKLRIKHSEKRHQLTGKVNCVADQEARLVILGKTRWPIANRIEGHITARTAPLHENK